MGKLSDYFRGSVEELKKVQWPTKKETTRHTVMVIVISLAVAIFIGVIDLGLNKGLERLIG